MREGKEREVTVGNQARVGGIEGALREAGHAGQLRMDDADRLAYLAVRGDCGDFQVRMSGQQPKQLSPGIAAGTGNCHPRSHALLLRRQPAGRPGASLCMIMRMSACLCKRISRWQRPDSPEQQSAERPGLCTAAAWRGYEPAVDNV